MPYSSRVETSIELASLRKRVRELEAENEMLRLLLSRHGYPANTDVAPETARRVAAN